LTTARSRVSLALVTALATLVMPRVSSDAADLSVNGADWICGKAFAVTRGLGRLALRAETMRGASGQGEAKRKRTPPYFVAQLPDLGTVLFVKRGPAWVGYAIEDGGAIQSVKQSDHDRTVIAFSMLSREGPGNSYTVLSTRDGFASIVCSSLQFPKELNEPMYLNEYLAFVDFNMDTSGVGTLIGSAHIERDGQSITRTYRYRTQDAGVSWSEPELMEALARPLSGVLRDAGRAPVDVITDFRRSLRLR
jgi:hypothetical protein